MVVPVSDLGAETPVWVGEDLPVPFDIAMDVGAIRRRISEALDAGKKKSEIASELALPLEKSGLDFVTDTIAKQKKQGEVPTDKLITIEKHVENYQHIVINSCFGTKVNDTLARVLASLLSMKYGEGVGVKVDPYRIVLTGIILEEDEVEKTLKSLNPDALREILEKTVINTNLFRFSFAHVGKRFGVFKDDVNFREINMTRVIDAYKGTAVYMETLDEVFKKYFDIEDARKALGLILRGEIELDTQAFTTISFFGLEQFKDAVQAETPERAIIETVKSRLLKRKVSFVCLHCGEVMRNRTIDTLKYPLTCPACESWMMCPMNKYEDELSSLVKKKNRGRTLTKQEELYWKSANKAAGLVHSFEKKALLAMNARGVGPRTAGRLLNLNLTEDELFKEILNAEREFVRTSRFWRK
jgi:ATP-dependent Lhr-like helicase